MCTGTCITLSIQFVRRRSGLIASFHGESRHSAYIDATFGGFPTLEALSYIPQAYEDAFNPTILKHLPSAWIAVVKGHGRYSAPVDTPHAHATTAHT